MGSGKKSVGDEALLKALEQQHAPEELIESVRKRIEDANPPLVIYADNESTWRCFLAMRTQWIEHVDGSLKGLNYALLQAGSIIYRACGIKDADVVDWFSGDPVNEIESVFQGLQIMEAEVLKIQHERRNDK